MFEVNRSSYRYWKKRPKGLTTNQLQTEIAVKAAHKLSGGSAGARSISSILTNSGNKLSRYLAAKAMKRAGIVSKQPPKHNYKPAQKVHIEIPNHLDREFSPVKPNQVWCGDITYLWVGDRWHYLAAVLDLYGRKIVGFAMSDSPDSDLTKRALMNAYESRGRPKNVMFHSDQGCHYTSIAFRQLIWKLQIKQSMSRRGNCWDNAPMERFFRSLKSENMPKSGYHSIACATKNVTNYIFRYYNSVRPHTHNLGLSPKAKEDFYLGTSNRLAKKS